MTAKVFVTLKKGVRDPQGKAVEQSLARLGFPEAREGRGGRFIELAVEARSREEASKRIDAMCKKLLANTVIEDYRPPCSSWAMPRPGSLESPSMRGSNSDSAPSEAKGVGVALARVLGKPRRGGVAGRARVTNLGRAEQGPGADYQQRALRSRFQQRLMPGVSRSPSRRVSCNSA